jgi:hypothetical protein
MPVDYSQSKIYRLACNEDPSLCYYGSTTQPLSKRLHQHKVDYGRWTEGKGGRYVTSFELCKHQSVLIVLVENVLAADKAELHAHERRYIENHPCVNKNVPGRTVAEYYADNRENILTKRAERYSANREAIKESAADYYAANREAILVKQAEYNAANREAIKTRKAERYSANREAILVKQAEYNAANRETIKTKITCACGSIVSRTNKAAHERSNKHQATLAGTSTA